MSCHVMSCHIRPIVVLLQMVNKIILYISRYLIIFQDNARSIPIFLSYYISNILIYLCSYSRIIWNIIFFVQVNMSDLKPHQRTHVKIIVVRSKLLLSGSMFDISYSVNLDILPLIFVRDIYTYL